MGAELLALAVRRILRDDAIFNVLSSDVSNGVELVLEKRRSVSRMPDVSQALIEILTNAPEKFEAMVKLGLLNSRM